MHQGKKPRGIRRDRHCHACRARGIKCDLNRPRCRSCAQDRRPCTYPRRVVWMEEKSSPSSLSPTLPSPEIPGSNEPRSHTSIGLYSFVDLLADCHHRIRSSQRRFPAEAIELVARTLEFARSRINGAKHHDTTTPTSSTLASIQLNVAVLMGLSQLVESAHPLALFGIATFAIFEVCSGSFGRWHCHLRGARSLLDLHCRNRAEFEALSRRITGLTDVLSYLVWFDATGALVRGGQLIFDDWHRETLQTSFYDSVGCPPATFELFVHLVKEFQDPDALDAGDLTWRAMDQMLQSQSGDWTTDRGLAAVVYRYTGAIVALARAGCSQDVSTALPSRVLSSMVDKVCESVAAMNVRSKFYIHMATPVYLAGMNATTEAQCAVFRTYWRNCQLGDFPRYPDGQAQCERRWRNNRVIV
ncbi:hypothetical protein P170DRAFT_406012 [Aspergillus steynii IBT 23096]|uniref:Zn(2)-C6 fungal-type domain-containing protein n=1 Tax=Aspergillus steynii IBT 23096 TaxID=1392250 RepID=A0A2I2GCQ8_9EURO|nr:uncharacterized protein P170DRAFT_406012 [Aspergillus steynii IBT 23096]PLB50668.1 hypothetical protein P170DRAFT_406012 [Aspergillus steynii IBT 23096]